MTRKNVVAKQGRAYRWVGQLEVAEVISSLG